MSIVSATWTSLSFAVANFPVLFSGIKIQQGVRYGDKPWQTLDVYSLSDASADSPVIVFFYGGRWTTGKKEQYKFVALRFSQLGYKVVIPDYSKYPDVKFPSFVEDAALAIAWTHEHVGENLYVAGHSAGAHIGALVTVDPSYLGKLGKDRSIIKAFAGLAGPYAFEPDKPDLKEIFGPAENYPLMQVPSFVDGNQPPMLLLHGEGDKDVMLFNLERLDKKIKKTGGVVETKIYSGVDHIKILAAFSWVWQDKMSVEEDIDSFFRKVSESNDDAKG